MIASHKTYKTYNKTYKTNRPHYPHHLLLILSIFQFFNLSIFLSSCTTKPTAIPTAFSETADSLVVFPDYRDVTIPPNIAPLNFMVTDAGASEFVASFEEARKSQESPCLVVGALADGKFDIDSIEWRQLLSDAKGQDLTISIFAHRPAGWVRYAPFTLSVAEEEIDPYLSYRLIEPGYELYRQLGLYQRNLTNFQEAVIYENNRSFDADNNHCINCHNYQAYDTERMLFHVRASHGGTVIVNGSEAHKVAIRHDSILSSGVYPSWHPTQPLVAFSTNKTGQVFHMYHPEKIEVLDEASDLLLYDAEANSVRHILRTDDALETFPCWAPDGQTLYYCSATLPESLYDAAASEIALKYDSLLYNIYAMSYDSITRSFGEPQLVVDAAGMGKSTSVPRVSPDGRYLLFTLGDYGQFHIWHKSADLWMVDLQASTTQPLMHANAPDQPDSYHGWSSNGRWIAFASRRIDGNYSRVFISYFDREGRDHKAFLLPQRDPEHNTLLLKSYNVPELTKSPVHVTTEQLKHVVLHTESTPAAYEN